MQLDIRTLKAYIVYRPERLDNVKRLQEIFPNNELVLGRNYKDINDELKSLYISPSFYKRYKGLT